MSNDGIPVASGYITVGAATGNYYPEDVAVLNDFDPATDAVANVTLVGTTTTNTDMRGTDGANTVVPDASGSAASALSDIHLDHLLAVDYDPAVPPGVATALFNELIESNAGVSRYTAGALANAAGGGAATGARLVTVTVTDGTDPLENATVRFTEGVNTYAILTNVSGVATINLDDATYAVAVTKIGYAFTGTTLLVNGDKTPTYAMSAVTVTLPSDPNQATGVIRCYDELGVAKSGVVVSVVVKQGPGTAGLSYNNATWSVTSDVNGDASFVGLVRGATYRAYRGTETVDTEYIEFQVPDRSSFLITEIVGTE